MERREKVKDGKVMEVLSLMLLGKREKRKENDFSFGPKRKKK